MSLSLVLVAGTAVLHGRRQLYQAAHGDRLIAMLPPWQTGTHSYRLALWLAWWPGCRVVLEQGVLPG